MDATFTDVPFGGLLTSSGKITTVEVHSFKYISFLLYIFYTYYILLVVVVYIYINS